MKLNNIFKIICLNIGIAVINIFIFSPGLLGISIGESSIFSTALGLTIIIMSIIIFIYSNYALILKNKKSYSMKDIKTIDDLINALKGNRYKKTFTKNIEFILEQIERLQDKKETIESILLQKFSSNEMSYSKFRNVIRDVENLFYINIRSILNKLNAFDEDDYLRIRNQNMQVNLPYEFFKEKMDIYNDYITFVKDSIEDNEHILLKLDKLLLEISKYNSLEDGEIENMNAMKEIDDLINKTKLYK